MWGVQALELLMFGNRIKYSRVVVISRECRQCIGWGGTSTIPGPVSPFPFFTVALDQFVPHGIVNYVCGIIDSFTFSPSY